jgi:hypothetical protein
MSLNIMNFQNLLKISMHYQQCNNETVQNDYPIKGSFWDMERGENFL